MIKETKLVYVVAESMISALDFGTEQNMAAIYNGETAIKLQQDKQIYPEDFMGAKIDQKRLNRCFSSLSHYNQLAADFEFTIFEKMAIMSMAGIFRDQEFPTNKKSLFILSSTKGNIDLLQEDNLQKWGKERLMLWNTANIIRRFWGFENKAMVISNACVSGIEAIALGSQLIKAGKYEHAIVVGADMLSEFVVSGFMSFQSLSKQVCQPFDQDRDGLNLGEAAACVFLSSDKNQLAENEKVVVVSGGGSSNDANHISGPSRSGDGQFFAIEAALKEAHLSAKHIDYVSAHGTATPYNDEMESKALTLAQLQNKPIHSLKAYFGHTLGAAGVLESVVCIQNLRHQKIVKSLGFKKLGVPLDLNIITQTKEQALQHIIKTASGFGGSNAAIIFSLLKKEQQ